MKNIARLTSYGTYLDCSFTVAPYPGEEKHIVGELADYVYDLEHDNDQLEHNFFDAERYLDIEQQNCKVWKQRYNNLVDDLGAWVKSAHNRCHGDNEDLYRCILEIEDMYHRIYKDFNDII